MTARRLHVVAAVLQDGDRYFVQQRQPDKHMAGYWEFPGGKVESGETPWCALVRELEEELGILATVGAPLIKLTHQDSEREVYLDLWRVTAWNGEPFGKEQQAVSWNTVAELRDMKVLSADLPVLDVL